MKINNKLLKINHSEILNKPIYYQAWGMSITFNVPIGRQAIVIVSMNDFFIVWNPPDNVGWKFISAQQYQYSITRDANNTTKITITKTAGGNSTFSVIVLV